MLILTRRVGQSIMIGDGIELKVVEIKGDQVRLGIVAPAEVAVHRREVYDQIKAENVQAAHSARADVVAGLSGLIRSTKRDT